MRQNCTLIHFLCFIEATLSSVLVITVHHDYPLARSFTLSHLLAVRGENFLGAHVELRVYFVLGPAPAVFGIKLQRFTNHARLVGARFNLAPRHDLVRRFLANLP